jgi:hypothetical protein
MNIKTLAGIVILIFVFIMGCSGTNGKIVKQTGTEDKMTLAELRENWEEYTIYYSYRWDSRPSAIMFDPKNNDKKLVGDSWYKIEDQEALSETIRTIQQQYDYAKVEIIEGPDNKFFGYMYYPYWLHIPVKIVDERTLYVGTLPPYQSAP